MAETTNRAVLWGLLAPNAASGHKHPSALEHEFQQPGSKRSRSINFSSLRANIFRFRANGRKTESKTQRGNLKNSRLAPIQEKSWNFSKTHNYREQWKMLWANTRKSIHYSVVHQCWGCRCFSIKIPIELEYKSLCLSEAQTSTAVARVAFSVMIHIFSNNSCVMNICSNLAAFGSHFGCFRKHNCELHNKASNQNQWLLSVRQFHVDYKSITSHSLSVLKGHKVSEGGSWQLICVISCHSPIAGHKNRIRRLAVDVARTTILVDKKVRQNVEIKSSSSAWLN